ncbi:MAG: hypothetical protein MJ025_07185 [Victivallaceae bacterium]|nr:hypothetical protein [Victivallaceae bacterium]
MKRFVPGILIALLAVSTVFASHKDDMVNNYADVMNEMFQTKLAGSIKSALAKKGYVLTEDEEAQLKNAVKELKTETVQEALESSYPVTCKKFGVSEKEVERKAASKKKQDKEWISKFDRELGTTVGGTKEIQSSVTKITTDYVTWLVTRRKLKEMNK